MPAERVEGRCVGPRRVRRGRTLADGCKCCRWRFKRLSARHLLCRARRRLFAAAAALARARTHLCDDADKLGRAGLLLLEVVLLQGGAGERCPVSAGACAPALLAAQCRRAGQCLPGARLQQIPAALALPTALPTRVRRGGARNCGGQKLDLPTAGRAAPAV